MDGDQVCSFRGDRGGPGRGCAHPMSGYKRSIRQTKKTTNERGAHRGAPFRPPSPLPDCPNRIRPLAVTKAAGFYYQQPAVPS